MTDDITDDTSPDVSEHDEATDDEATDSEASADDERRSGGLLRDKRMLAALAAATVAFIAAVVFGVLWWLTTASSEYRISAGRTDALEAAETGVLAYTVFAHQKPETFRDRQRAISTDELNDQIEKGWKKTRDLIVKNRVKVDVSVVDLGVSKLDTHKGDAEVLAAIKVSRSTKGAPKESALLRMVAELKRVGDEWKLSSIGAAPELGSTGSE